MEQDGEGEEAARVQPADAGQVFGEGVNRQPYALETRVRKGVYE